VTIVPYADPEKRRQFQRQYKRKWRKLQERINPLLAFRVYICPRFPFLWVGREQFYGGFLVTDNAVVQAEVETHPDFGKSIFRLVIDITCTPTADEDE
jgi:hypothetical protein